jgi:hypothetical protein
MTSSPNSPDQAWVLKATIWAAPAILGRRRLHEGADVAALLEAQADQGRPLGQLPLG